MIEVENLKRIITIKNGKLDIFKEKIMEKYGIIIEYHKTKIKLQGHLEKI